MVSAIITTHNRKNDVLNAINSVKKQNYSDIEIIVVDDASEDDTDKLLNSLDGITYIKIDKANSKGGNHARNIGIQASQGDLIAFLDDDDTWKVDKISKQVSYMESHLDCKMVYTAISVLTGNILFNYDVYSDKTSYGDVLTTKGYWRPICVTSTMMVRRDVLLEIGGFDEKLKYWQEYELTLRIIQKGIIGYINEPLIFYSKPIKKSIKKLTNNYDSWEDSVKYIYTKHSNLFERLDNKLQLLKEETYIKEAAYRLGSIGDNKVMKKMYKRAYELTGKKEYFIRYLFGLSRQKTVYLESIFRKIIAINKKFRLYCEKSL